MATRADLIRETADEIFGLASGQPVEADVSAKIDARVDATIDFLSRTDVIYIASADEFDDALLNPLAAFLADVCRPKFLIPSDPGKRRQASDELSLLQRAGSSAAVVLTVDKALTSRRRY